MNETFKKYVTEIVRETDSSTETKSDLFEELMTHLEESYNTLINEGMNEEEAEREALKSFGNAQNIGNNIRQAMFPYQREFLFALALSSIVYSFTVYLVQLFIEGDAHSWWLVTSIGISLVLVLFVYHVIQESGKKWLNSALVIHAMTYFYGLGLALGIDHYLVTMLTIFCILILLLTLVLLYINVIFHWEMSPLKKGFHIYNISLGLISIAINLLFIWAFLLFAPAFSLINITLFIPIAFWILSYIFQIQLVNKGWVKVSIGIASIPAILVIGFIVFQMSMIIL